MKHTILTALTALVAQFGKAVAAPSLTPKPVRHYPYPRRFSGVAAARRAAKKRRNRRR